MISYGHSTYTMFYYKSLLGYNEPPRTTFIANHLHPPVPPVGQV